MWYRLRRRMACPRCCRPWNGAELPTRWTLCRECGWVWRKDPYDPSGRGWLAARKTSAYEIAVVIVAFIWLAAEAAGIATGYDPSTRPVNPHEHIDGPPGVHSGNCVFDCMPGEMP